MNFEQVPTSAPKTKTEFSFNDALTDLRSGKKSSSIAKIFEYAGFLKSEAKELLMDQIQQVEHVSKSFSEKLFSDKAFFKRVMGIARNFSENGETMSVLEEAEIYTELMEPGYDDLARALEVSDPARSFTNLESMKKDEVIYERLSAMRKLIDGEGDKIFREELRGQLTQAFASLGLGSIDDDATWKALSVNKTVLDELKKDPQIREIYAAATYDQSIDRIDRNAEMLWRSNENGEVNPVLHVHRYAKNPENGYVSQLGFDIEKDQGKRIIKNIIVETDADSRGKNQGPEFLLNLLPMIKAYDLKEAEFVANINIGSYVWTKIADIDIGAMQSQLSPEAKIRFAEIQGDAKKEKALIMSDRILPEYEAGMSRAAYMALNGESDPIKKAEIQKIVDDLLGRQYPALKEKVLLGEATMEDLANLGKGMDFCSFTKEGNLVGGDTSEAVMRGHLGKAALMGIPWKARIPLNRESLFGIIDKLHKGKGFMSSLKRTGMKFGLLFQS